MSCLGRQSFPELHPREPFEDVHSRCYDFPKGFVWGVATSAYQIEGAAEEGGKGLSVWDMFCRKPGVIWDGNTGEVACDHYHRYREDVALMKKVGIAAYRFSPSWPRILPEGTGKVNKKGLEFYDRLIDELLSAGITPYLNLFHWSYPYELYCRGGWLNPESPEWFAEYVRVMVEKLSDRVKHWLTFNEPQCFIGFGHRTARHAPGDKLEWREILRAGHNALLAHGKAVMAIRKYAQSDVQIGIAPVGVVRVPNSDSAEDIAAAREATLEVVEKDFWNNAWWLDPVFLKHYPESGLKVFGGDVPEVKSGDMEIISQPLDFLGLNIYRGRRIRAGGDGRPEEVPEAPGHPLTSFRWPVTPEALYWGPRFISERYRLPIIITENGMTNLDWPSVDRKVHDPQRIDFLTRYLRELKKAIDEGVDIRGYFLWTLMDNFEWAEGFRERFGLIYVDFTTQKRILKDSAYWYKNLIASNGAILKICKKP